MSEHKSSELERIAKANEWRTQIVPVFPDDFDDNPDANRIEWNLYGVRDGEMMHVKWEGDLQVMATYTCGEYTLNPHRRGSVVRLLSSRPDIEKMSKALAQKLTPEEMVKARQIPWDDDAPAIEIMQAVIGKEVTWLRRFDGQVCSARVHVNLKDPITRRHFKICEHANGRNLEWVDSYGFHAVALEQIVGVA